MTASTLTGFLLARVAEDEAAARAASPGGWSYGDVASVAGGSLYDETRMIAGVRYEQPEDHDGSIVRHLLSSEADANGRHIARHDPARVLAGCASKRAIVERYEFVAAAGGETSELAFHEQGLFEAVMSLAQIYADHPDFRDEWRVES